MSSPTGELPVLPYIHRPIDNTALSAYKTCPREYKFGMILHRRRRGGASPALTFGSAIHAGLASHYRTGGNEEEAVAAIALDWEDHGAVGDYRTLARCIHEYTQYVKHYGPPEKERGQTVGFPDSPLVEISTQVHHEDLVHPYAGKLDRIIELDGLHYVEDHKTTSRFDRHYWSQFQLSNQMMGYVWMARRLFPSLTVVGVRINLLHILTSKSDFHRQLFTYSPQRLDDWAANTNKWMLRINQDTKEDDFPAHYGDNGCSRKFGMCQYHEVCSLPTRFQERRLEAEFDLDEWNPLTVDKDND